MKLCLPSTLVRVSPLIFIGILLSEAKPASSQLTPDNTLGDESSVVNPRNETSDSIDGGALRGQNLFHSFQEFNVGEGRGAYFAKPDAVSNIFSRVTGNNPSNILGTLGVDGAANLYLVNPNGIVFGENSSLDVQGSFTATTADAIEFGEGGLFSAVAPGESLLTISVPLGLQFGSTPGSIINRSVGENPNGETNITGGSVGLQVPEEKTLALVGGNILLNDGNVTAKGGQIEVGSVLGQGVVKIIEVNTNFSLNYDLINSFGDVTLQNTSVLDVTNDGGGDIDITAENLSINDSVLHSGIVDSNSIEAQAGDITIDVNNNLTINNGEIWNELEEGGIGNAGDINLVASSIDVINTGIVAAATDGQGNTGTINIFADKSVNVGDENGTVFIANNVFENGRGNSQGINFVVGSLFIKNGSQIQSLAEGEGNSGKIFINASNTVSFDGANADDEGSAALSSVQEDAMGNAGGIEVIASTLSLTNRAQFSSSTQGTGNAGDVSITVGGKVELGNSSIFTEVSAPNENGIEGNGGFGNGGDVIIKANSLLLEDGSSISSDTENVGNAGNITIEVDENIIIRGEGRGAFPGDTDIFSSQISSTAEINSIGNGGNISISANELAIINDVGFITSATASSGNAANIDISVNELSINDGFISSSTSSSGNAADLNIFTNNLFLTTGGQISASTSGSGNAGNIVINASDTIFMDGVDSDDFPSSLFTGVGEEGSGQGGDIIVGTTQSPKQLILTNGARINTASSGIGNSGSINLDINGSLQATNSFISTSSTQSSGGNLTIDVGDVQLRGDSDFTTNIASGEGSGGNVNISADSVLAFDDSDIFAFAPEGQGGNITLDTPAFFAENFTLNSLTANPDDLDLNNRADVNATGAVSGAVDIPDVSFIQNSLTELPNNSIDTDELVANSCVVPTGERSLGKFIITGGESLPVRPGDNLPSKYPTGEVRGASEDNSSWQPGDPIVEAQNAYRLANGEWVLSRECSG